MLSGQPDHQNLLYKEIIYKQMNVREAERISRHIAVERSRKRDENIDHETRLCAEKLSDALGTRVSIERKGERGKISIEFFSEEELNSLLNKIKNIYENKEKDFGYNAEAAPGMAAELCGENVGAEEQKISENPAENFTI